MGTVTGGIMSAGTPPKKSAYFEELQRKISEKFEQARAAENPKPILFNVALRKMS